MAAEPKLKMAMVRIGYTHFVMPVEVAELLASTVMRGDFKLAEYKYLTSSDGENKRHHYYKPLEDVVISAWSEVDHAKAVMYTKEREESGDKS